MFFRRTKKEQKSRQLTRSQALDCRVHLAQGVQVSQQSTQGMGTMLVKYPLQINPFFLRLSSRYFHNVEKPMKKLELDQHGSQVVQLIDGCRDVRSIIREFAAASAFSLQEAEQSVTEFLRQLGRRGIVVLEERERD